MADHLLCHFAWPSPRLSTVELNALAAETAKRRLPDPVRRLVGIYVASGRQKVADAIQTALRLER